VKFLIEEYTTTSVYGCGDDRKIAILLVIHRLGSLLLIWFLVEIFGHVALKFIVF